MVFFSQEDLERELSKLSRTSRGAGPSPHIMVILGIFLRRNLLILLLTDCTHLFAGGEFRRRSKEIGGEVKSTSNTKPNVYVVIDGLTLVYLFAEE